MNYCTNCGAGRSAGTFCGECGVRHGAADVLVDTGEPVDDDEGAGARSGRRSSGGGWLVVLGVALLLALVFGYGASRPEIDTSSAAYAQGREAAAAYIASGAELTGASTAQQVCDVTVRSGATDEARAAAANNEAGCRAALEEHLHAAP